MNYKKEIISYYSHLLVDKIDQHAEAFITRIKALRNKDTDTVEYFERMVLEPLNLQIVYLAEKISSALE